MNKHSYKYTLEGDADKKKAAHQEFVEIHLPPWFTILNQRLAENESQHYFVGKSLTIADFAILGFLFALGKQNPSAYGGEEIQAVIDKHEHLKHYIQSHADVDFKEFLEKRPKGKSF